MEFPVMDFLMRWAHFVGALIWVGHNYASVVQRPNYQPLKREELVDTASDRFDLKRRSKVPKKEFLKDRLLNGKKSEPPLSIVFRPKVISYFDVLVSVILFKFSGFADSLYVS